MAAPARRMIVLVAASLLPLWLAGCSKGGSSLNAPPGTSLPPAPSLTPSGPPPSASSLPPSVFDRHADPGLEAMLPDSVAGSQLQTFSLTAAEFVTPDTEQAFLRFLDRLGRSEGDATLAVSVDPSGKVEGSINALRVAGAESQDLVPAFLTLEGERAPSLPQFRQGSLGGKAVTIAMVPYGDGFLTAYYYATQDVVFVIGGADRTTAELFLEALP